MPVRFKDTNEYQQRHLSSSTQSLSLNPKKKEKIFEKRKDKPPVSILKTSILPRQAGNQTGEYVLLGNQSKFANSIKYRLKTPPSGNAATVEKIRSSAPDLVRCHISSLTLGKNTDEEESLVSGAQKWSKESRRNVISRAESRHSGTEEKMKDRGHHPVGQTYRVMETDSNLPSAGIRSSTEKSLHLENHLSSQNSAGKVGKELPQGYLERDLRPNQAEASRGSAPRKENASSRQHQPTSLHGNRNNSSVRRSEMSHHGDGEERMARGGMMSNQRSTFQRKSQETGEDGSKAGRTVGGSGAGRRDELYDDNVGMERGELDQRKHSSTTSTTTRDDDYARKGVQRSSFRNHERSKDPRSATDQPTLSLRLLQKYGRQQIQRQSSTEPSQTAAAAAGKKGHDVTLRSHAQPNRNTSETEKQSTTTAKIDKNLCTTEDVHSRRKKRTSSVPPPPKDGKSSLFSLPPPALRETEMQKSSRLLSLKDVAVQTSEQFTEGGRSSPPPHHTWKSNSKSTDVETDESGKSRYQGREAVGMVDEMVQVDLNQVERKRTLLKNVKPSGNRSHSEYQRQFQWRLPPPSTMTSSKAHKQSSLHRSNPDLSVFSSDAVQRHRSEYRHRFRPISAQNRRTSSGLADFYKQAQMQRSGSLRELSSFDAMKEPGNENTSSVTMRHHHHRRPKKFRSEYRSSFQSPWKYEWESGIWKELVRNSGKEEKKDSQKWESVEGGVGCSSGSSWFEEVLELRRRADEYRKRSLGTHFSREHLAQLYAKNSELWDAVVSRNGGAVLSDVIDVKRRGDGNRSSSAWSESSLASDVRNADEWKMDARGRGSMGNRRVFRDEEAGRYQVPYNTWTRRGYDVSSCNDDYVDDYDNNDDVMSGDDNRRGSTTGLGRDEPFISHNPSSKYRTWKKENSNRFGETSAEDVDEVQRRRRINSENEKIISSETRRSGSNRRTEGEGDGRSRRTDGVITEDRSVQVDLNEGPWTTDVARPNASLASQVLERARNRKDEFWSK